MSNPLKTLRSGIEQGSWQTVCKGFKLLTGETLQPPATTDSSPANDAIDAIQSIIIQFRNESNAGQEEPSVEEDDEEDETLTMIEPEEEEPPEDDDPMAAFRVNNLGRPRPGAATSSEDDDKGAPCRKEPWDKSKAGKNNFRDNGKDKEDQAYLPKKRKKATRPPFKTYKVTCSRCNRENEVGEIDLPRKFGGGSDQNSQYICNNCVPRGNR